jgi:predicted nucleic-acid-binding protein
MIGLDTDVLVRYVMQDDANQSVLATKLIEGLSVTSPAFISLVTIVELVWVLRSALALSRAQVSEVIVNLISVDSFKIEKPTVVAEALRAYQSGNADLADCLIERSSFQAGCKRTMTFDQAASKTANMELIK